MDRDAFYICYIVLAVHSAGHFDNYSNVLYFFLCAVFAGKAGELIDRGDNTYGGKFVVNPSGGLISKGHPLGATGTQSL